MIPANQVILVNAWIVQTKEEADNILLHGGKIIIITEDTPEYLMNQYVGTSSLMANCLLPDYEAVSYYVDGDYQNFSRCYNELLMRPENVVYFITMISAMINDIPLGFVFGVEEIEQASAVELLNHFANVYGIHLGHNLPFANQAPTQGWMDRNYSANNVSLLYANNLLTPQEYLYIYPPEIRLDVNALQKLVIDLRPPLQDFSMENIEAYFDMMRTSIKKANKILVDPLVMP